MSRSSSFQVPASISQMKQRPRSSSRIALKSTRFLLSIRPVGLCSERAGFEVLSATSRRRTGHATHVKARNHRRECGQAGCEFRSRSDRRSAGPRRATRQGGQLPRTNRRLGLRLSSVRRRTWRRHRNSPRCACSILRAQAAKQSATATPGGPRKRPQVAQRSLSIAWAALVAFAPLVIIAAWLGTAQSVHPAGPLSPAPTLPLAMGSSPRAVSTLSEMTETDRATR
jgi:hypothetical protein